ncbi:MAG: acyl-[ACP]--phospholipid O-acyltransferase [Planctomycetota bacterium]|nr:acyl-[ACP]--phospholipid O-acyltransferase [Planctomycetota bacterium]
MNSHSQGSQRGGTVGLYVAQFGGAFNDAAFKFFAALIAMQVALAAHPTADKASEEQSATALALVVFTLPLILFSLPAGVWADRVSKRSQIVWVKVFEIALMLTGVVLLRAHPTDASGVLWILGGLGVHSAFFSPAKYGILPEIVPHERLSKANALLETFTILAIIAGSVAGPALHASVGERTWIVPAVLTTVAILGTVAALSVPRVPAAGGGATLVGTLAQGFAAIRASRVLSLSIAGSAFFFFLAAAVSAIAFAAAQSSYSLSDELRGLPLGLMGIGFAVGALSAGRLSQNRVELGLVPLGGIGISGILVVVGMFDLGTIVAMTLFTLFGIASGLVVIPLNALVQWRAPEDRRGAVLGISNTIVYFATLCAAGAQWTAAHNEWSSRSMFLALGVIAVLGTLWALWLLPEAFLRLALVLATRTIYRLRVKGLENVPEKGGALLAPNHVAMVDGLFLMAVIDRPIRFLVDRDEYEKWWQKPFMKALDAIPISARGGPREMLRALRDAGKHLEDGHLVCIFPEGQLTRNGMMQPFRRGVERIAKGRDAPIVPIYLGNVWGSVFSGSRGKFVWKMPEQIPYPVSILFGSHMSDTASAADIRRAVGDLGEMHWSAAAREREPLHRDFLRSVRAHPSRRAVYDAQGGHLSRAKLAAAAIVFGRLFRGRWNEEKAIGILLPPSIASTALNIACALSGKPSVNLNYTAGRAGLDSASKQAQLKRVITSRAFIEKGKIETPSEVELIYLEDERAKIGGLDKLRALMAARWANVARIERSCGATREPRLDDVVTIIFSSGSTGEPKGVPLTHMNLAANTAGIAQVFSSGSNEGLLGILPTFHSFGYMAMWFALNHGVFLACHPNPLDAPAVGELVEKHRLTLMICTPTFLGIYLRRVPPAQFGSLRVVMAGAEKLNERVASAFEDRFGLRPIEGYGTTECSPAVAVSTPTVRRAGVHQPGSKKGSVGQALPGVTLAIVDPDTFAPLPAETPGMLLVKGANVMSGYLNRPDLTAKVLRDGWYVTGDIAMLDDEGFLRITDRLSRFSKIGGEMVPHGRVEEALHQAAGSDLPVFAVTALPDEKKGERLAVLTTLDLAKLPPILEALAKSGLPNLFLPRIDAFVKVEALPLLGTGKLDLKRVKQIAAESLVRANT